MIRLELASHSVILGAFGRPIFGRTLIAVEDVCSCISLEQNECNAQTGLGRRFQEHGEIDHAFLEVDA